MSKTPAFNTDIRRTITGNFKRFISIFIICALGAAMLVGLTAACEDLRLTADAYYDDQCLFDMTVQSTLGLTGKDVDVLADVDGVKEAAGSYTESVYSNVKGRSERVDARALVAGNMNEPLVVEGRLPRAANEIAVNTAYARAAGKKVGDRLSVAGDPSASSAQEDGEADTAGTEESPEVFARGTYRIVGVVRDPMNVNSDGASMGFRTTSASRYTFFMSPKAVKDPDTFTVAYVRVSGASALKCYSDEYRQRVDEVARRIEAVRGRQERVRTQTVKDAAYEQIDKREADLRSQLDAASAELDVGADALERGRDEYAAGKTQVSLQERLASQRIAAARAQVDAAASQLRDGRAKLVQKKKDVQAGLVALEQAPANIDEQERSATQQFDQKEQELAAGQEKLAQARSELEKAATGLESDPALSRYWPADAWHALAAASAPEEAEAAAAQVSAVIDPVVDEAIAWIDGILAKLPPVEGEGQGRASDVLGDAPALVSAYADRAGGAGADLQALRRILLELKERLGQVKAMPQGMVDVVRGEASIREGIVSLKDAREKAAAGFASARERVGKQRAQAQEGLSKISSGISQADVGLSRLAAANDQINAQERVAAGKIAKARGGLAAAADKIAQGQRDWEAGQRELLSQRSKAYDVLASARKKADGMEGATWYVQDRSSLASYTSVDSDASSIEAIATVFPVIFFAVAVLISLTTVTRMVEEDRGLIGVYKALGYSRGKILSKYVIYSATACIAGGLAGDAIGFTVLPQVLFGIFSTMYALPPFQLHFALVPALLGVALFAVGIVGATLLACRLVLRETPASLMRPRAPRAGSRILLERIRPIWSRMGFLSKVTARNLFRYKKRFFMTVFGIAGCTALIVCGLGIRDTVISLKPRQYGQDGIVRYDLMAVMPDADYATGREKLAATGETTQELGLRLDSVTAMFAGKKEPVQIMVVPRGQDMSAYVKLETLAGEPLVIPEDGVLITKNAQQVLGFNPGDTVVLQDSSFAEGTVRVDQVCANYLGNFVFMDEDTFQRAFGAPAQRNAVLANLKGSGAHQMKVAQELGADPVFASVTSTAKVADGFSDSFKVVDVVVYVVTVMAAALSFAVVFTLSTTNISERERELATIKVLGFRRREVYRYINKETIILTLVGIAAGCPLGYLITRALTWILRMPALYFDTIVQWPTYVIAGCMSLLFTLIINAFTNRALDRVDMVGALKSAE